MKMDYRETKEGLGFIEPGVYTAEIVDIVKKATEKAGHELWDVEFKIVTNNDFYDRKIRDNIIFMDTLQSRNKSIFRALGYDVDNQEIDVQPNDLLSKRVKIEIVIEHYEKDGEQKETRKVKFFDGWSIADIDGMNGEKNDDESIPF